MDISMRDAAHREADEGAAQGMDRRRDDRAIVDLECELRVGSGNWRKTRIANLTPKGFQVELIDMPTDGTQVYVRFGGMQMLQAEACWSDMGTAGCKFTNPLSPYVFDHIVASLA